MVSKNVASVLANAIESVTADNPEADKRRVGLLEMIRNVVRYPLKIIALFFAAPYLLVLVAASPRKDLLRRVLAGIGFVAAFSVAIFVYRFLTSFSGAVAIGKFFGAMEFIGFAFGTFLSLLVTVAFCLWLFFFICWAFLQMSSDDIVKALRSAANEAK